MVEHYFHTTTLQPISKAYYRSLGPPALQKQTPHSSSIMKRRRQTLFVMMTFCALESCSGATPHATNTVPLQCRRTPEHCKHQGHQRVAFLFSMLKRRTQRLKDAQLEDRLQPLPQKSHLIDYQPSSNGLSGKAKKIDAPSMYFASPVGVSGVNGDTTGTFASQDMILDVAINGNHINGAPVHSADQAAMVLSDVQSSLAVDAAINEATSSTQNNTSFKASLLTGLEVQTAAHRTRLLSDLLEGVKEGVMNAVDTEKEKIWFNEEKTRFWQFWKRGSTTPSETDSEVNTEAVPDQPTPAVSPITKQSTEENDNIHSSKFASRTITGLINALAQEVENLEVKVDSDPTTPLSNKTIHSIQIYFSRLGFQQLKMGDRSTSDSSTSGDRFGEIERITADEAFDRIDVDQSGGLDAEELASALKMAALMGGSNGGSYIGIRSKEKLSEMAARLIKLYDTNGDGFVDREEYAVMVRDMAFLKEKRLAQDEDVDTTKDETQETEGQDKKKGWFGFLNREENGITTVLDGDGIPTNDTAIRREVVDVTENEVFWSLVDQGEGSIVLEDLNLDLRRLLFGAIPVFKRVLPGGHLILKPFTATVTASFNREDIMNSFLVDAGLRKLVARALSLRVRSVRDLFDGAVFYGRTWKLFEQNSPLVEVPKLQDVQFDSRNRLIITGRARIKAAPDAPTIENGFKLRTKIGTGENGRIIGLREPEIAVFAECPKAIESRVRTSVKDWFDYTIPTFQPLYTFIPLQSPFKQKDKINGFNLGEDNRIRSIEIKNGKLCFEFSAILRPGRFLGSHYLAFTVPIRTMIITLDRVKEGMRTARRNKRAADRAARDRERLLKEDAICDEECAIDEVLAQSISGKSSIISIEGRERLQKLEADFQAVEDESSNKDDSEKQKSFLSRFVEGFSGARDDEDLQVASLSSSISNFFGSQESDEL